MFQSNSKPCLIVLSSKPAASSFKLIDKGIKLSFLLQIKKLLNFHNIDWSIATLTGIKPLINNENDEKAIDWLKENEAKFFSPINLEKTEAKNYSGILFLNLFGYYSEFYSAKKTNEVVEIKEYLQKNENKAFTGLIREFCQLKRPIGFIGYGVIPLFQVFNGGEWRFREFNLTSIPISQEFREIYFSSLPFLIEETVRELEGNFVYSEKSNEIAMVDQNLVSGQNDEALMSVVMLFISLIKRMEG